MTTKRWLPLIFYFSLLTGVKITSAEPPVPKKGVPAKKTKISVKKGLSSPLFLSQGGAGGASLSEDFSYLINPATIGFQNKTKAAMAASLKKQEKTLLLSFLDLNTRWPMAITYQRDWSNSFQNHEKDKVTVSSGLKIAPYVSLGLAIERELKTSAWNGSLGSVFRMGEHLSLALYLDRILKTKGVNERLLSLAFFYKWKHFFQTRLDVSRTAKEEWIFRGGLKSFFHNYLSLQLGGTWWDKKKQALVSGGVAFNSPRFFLEYSLETSLKTNRQTFQHGGTLAFLF